MCEPAQVRSRKQASPRRHRGEQQLRRAAGDGAGAQWLRRTDSVCEDKRLWPVVTAPHSTVLHATEPGTHKWFRWRALHHVSARSLGHMRLLATPWTAAHQASLSITNCRGLHRLSSLKSVVPSNHLILCRPLLLPSTFPSIRVLSNELVLHIRWPKYWRFSIRPSNEYSSLISFRIDWFDLLGVHCMSNV